MNNLSMITWRVDSLVLWFMRFLSLLLLVLVCLVVLSCWQQLLDFGFTHQQRYLTLCWKPFKASNILRTAHPRHKSEGGKETVNSLRSAVTSDWKLPKRKQGTMLFVLCAPFLYMIYKFVLNTYSKSVVNAIRCVWNFIWTWVRYLERQMQSATVFHTSMERTSLWESDRDLERKCSRWE